APAEFRELRRAADEIEAKLAEHLVKGGRGGKARRAEREGRDRLAQGAGGCLAVLAPRGKWVAGGEAVRGGARGGGKKGAPADRTGVGVACGVGRRHTGGDLPVTVLRAAPQPGVGRGGDVVAAAIGGDVIPVPPGEAAAGRADCAERRGDGRGALRADRNESR